MWLCELLWATMCIARRAMFFVPPFVGILSQIKLLFGALVTCVVYTKTIIRLSVDESGRYLTRGSVNIHHYSPPLRWIIVNYYKTKLFSDDTENSDWFYQRSDFAILTAKICRSPFSSDFIPQNKQFFVQQKIFTFLFSGQSELMFIKASRGK